jgi:hypothetical protein
MVVAADGGSIAWEAAGFIVTDLLDPEERSEEEDDEDVGPCSSVPAGARRCRGGVRGGAGAA